MMALSFFYQEQLSPPRTDNNFRFAVNENHHKMTTPLVEIEIGFVSQFAFDPMHLVFLCVVKKLLYLWLKGPLRVQLDSAKKR